MIEIIPAIMPKNIEDMRSKMAQVLDATKIVQLDIMDGIFVPEKTFPYFLKDSSIMEEIAKEEESLPFWKEMDIELDLMVSDAEEKFMDFVSLGPRRIIFHYESLKNPKDFLENIDPYIKETIEIGLSFNNDTDINEIKDLISLVSFVQCMGIDKIGYQGKPFDERVIEKVKELRKEFPDLVISIDGAMNEETILKFKDLKVNRFVVGSAVFRSDDPKGMVSFLSSVI
jgi:ribulose-phosphate 3-epimerase